MKKPKLKHSLAPVFVIALAALLAVPVIAALGSKDITVYPGVSIYIDEQKLNPTDVNGNPVEVFIYNGTTYLPVRAVSEALGQVVQWDGNTSSVYIGKHTGDKPAVWLSDLDYFDKSSATFRGSWKIGGITKDNLGNEHDHSLNLEALGTTVGDDYISYKLNAQYNRLTGLFYQEYRYRDQSAITTLSIYGDGELLWSGKVGGGIDPVNLDIDVTGVLEIKIALAGSDSCQNTALGEVGLWH